MDDTICIAAYFYTSIMITDALFRRRINISPPIRIMKMTIRYTAKASRGVFC